MLTLQQSTERLKAQVYLHDEIRLAITAALLHKHAHTPTPTGWAAEWSDDPQVAVIYRQLFDMMENIHFPAQREESNKSEGFCSARVCQRNNNWDFIVATPNQTK